MPPEAEAAPLAPDVPAATPAKPFARLQEWFLGLPGNVQGAIWIIGAGLFFSIMSALIKVTGARIPVIEILFVRQIVLSIIVWPVIAPDLRGAFTTGNFKLHMLRIALALVAMIAGFTSTVHLPLADVTALAFTKSIFVTLFAIILLREKVGLHRWGATLLGFAGVGLMLKPSGDGSLYYGLLAILSAAAAGLIMVIIRKLAQNEKLSTIMAYQSFGVGAVLLVPTIWLWVTPTWFEALLMLLVGVTSAVGQSMNILGYRAGEAAMVAPMDYLRLIYASAIGILIFNDWPTLQTLAGAGIIVAASLYTMRREVKLGQKPSV
jgi:drug/metabolite transporter (DMT)-like permease